MSESWAGLEITFALLVRTAWCAAILLLLVGSIQKLAGRWLSPRARYALWLLVAARLVILWTPASSLSLVGQLEHRIANAMRAEKEPKVEAEPIESDIEMATPVDFALHLEAFPPDVPLAPLNITPQVPTWQWSDIPVWSIVAGLWILGVFIFGTLLGRDFWRLRSAIRAMVPVDEARVLDLVRRIEQELCLAGEVGTSPDTSPLHHVPMGERARVRGLFQRAVAVNKPVRVLVSQDLASPAVTGVFAPALLLPALFVERLTEKELEHVIRHELTHVKRRDVLVNWLLAGIGAVYWFFPLMRYLLSQLRKTRELACDATVLRSASANERKAYGKTLLKVMEMVSEADRPMLTFTVGVAGMVWNIGNFRKESKMMRERLELVVMDRSNRGRAGWLVGAMAIVLIAVGFTEAQDATGVIKEEEILVLTGEASQDAAQTTPPPKNGAYAAGYRDFEAPSGDLVSKDFDLTDAIAALKHPKRPDEKHAKQELEAWLVRVVKDSLWNGGAESFIFWKDNVATIRQTKQGHERLQRALSALRASHEQFAIEFSLGTLSAEDFQKLNLREYKNVNASVTAPRRAKLSSAVGAVQTVSRRIPSSIFALSPEQAAKLQKELYGFKSHSRLTSPTVATSSSVPAQIVSGTTRPFVTSFDRIAEGAEQPTVDVFYDGIETDLQAIALGEGKAWLRLCYRKSEVTGATKETQPGSSTEIQSPTIVETTQTVAQEITLGETLAIFGVASGKEKGKEEVIVVFANVRMLETAPRTINSEKSALRTEDLTSSPDPQRNPSESNKQEFSSVVYEVGDLVQYAPPRDFIKISDKLKNELTSIAYSQLVEKVKEAIPDFDKRLGNGIEFQPFYSPSKTLVIWASKDDHERIAKRLEELRRPKTHSGASNLAPSLDSAPQERLIYKALGKPVVIKFKDKPLRDVLNLLGKTTKINIVVDAAGFVEEGVQTSQPVSLSIQKPVTMQSALRLILDPLNLDFIVKNEVLLITSKRLTQRAATTVAYDVADLVVLIPPPEFVKLSDDRKSELTTKAFQQLIPKVSEAIPDFEARQNNGFEIQPFPTNLTLVISGTADDHERVAKRLEHLRQLAKNKSLPTSQGAKRTKADELNEAIALEMKIKGVKPSDMKGRTVAYDLSEFFLRCSNKSQGGMQPDNFDCGNPFTHVFAFLGQKIPELVPGEDTNEMQPFWADKLLIVSTTPELQEKVAEYLKQLNKMSPEEAKQLIEGNNLLADTNGRRANSIDEHGNILKCYEVHDQPLFDGLGRDAKEGDPKHDQAVAQGEKLTLIIRVAYPEFFAEKRGLGVQVFPTNQTLVVNAPHALQEKVQALLKRLSTMTPEACEAEWKKAMGR